MTDSPANGRPTTSNGNGVTTAAVTTPSIAMVVTATSHIEDDTIATSSLPSLPLPVDVAASAAVMPLSMPSYVPPSLTIHDGGTTAAASESPIGLYVHASPRPTPIPISTTSATTMGVPMSPSVTGGTPLSVASRRRAWTSSTPALAATAAAINSTRAAAASSTSVPLSSLTIPSIPMTASSSAANSARRNSTISIASTISIVTPQFAMDGRCGKRWIFNTTKDGGFKYLVLAGATCVCFLSGLSYVTSLYLVPFQDEFHVSRSVAALSSTLNFFFFALMCTFAGRLADYYGVKKVLSIGLILVIIGLLGTSFANGLPMVCIFFGAFLGAGLATAYMAALTVQPEWFPQRSGLAYGVTLAGSGLGNFVFAWAAQGSMDSYGWRTSLLVLTGVFAALAIVAVVLVQKKTVSIQETHRQITRAFTQLQLSGTMSIPESPALASATQQDGLASSRSLWPAAAARERERATSSRRHTAPLPFQVHHRPSINGSSHQQMQAPAGGVGATAAPAPQSSPLSVPSRSALAAGLAPLDISTPAATTSAPSLTGSAHHSDEKSSLSVPPSGINSDLLSSTSSSSSMVPSSSSNSFNIASVTVRSSPSISTGSPATGTNASAAATLTTPSTFGSGSSINIAAISSPSYGNNNDSFAISGMISPIGSIGSLEFITSARVHPEPSPSASATNNNGITGTAAITSSHRMMVLAPPNDLLQSPRSLLSQTQQLSARKGSQPVLEMPPPLPPLLDWKLLKSPALIWFMCSQAFITFPYYAPYVHLVAYADDNHLSTSQSSSLLMIISIGSLTGRLFFGGACDRFGALRCYRICCFIMIICCSLWIVCTEMISLSLLAAGFGISAGGVVATTTASCPPLVGKERASSALGLLYGIAWLPGSLATGYLMGWCKDQTGSYAAATYSLAGFALLAIFCSMMAERVSDISLDGDTDGDDVTDTLVINTVNVTDIPLHQPNMLVIDHNNNNSTNAATSNNHNANSNAIVA